MARDEDSPQGKRHGLDGPGVFASLQSTENALDGTLSRNPEAAAQLGAARQALEFTTALFSDLNDVDRLSGIPFDQRSEQALAGVEAALRKIRVAALALRDPAASAKKTGEQAAEGTASLYSEVSTFLAAFRAFLESASTGIRARFALVLDRYEEQLEARQLVAEVRETRDEAKRVLSDTRRAAGVTGESSLAQHFGEYARAEGWQANVLRIACVLTLLSIVAVAVVLLGDKHASELNTPHELARLAITVPLAVLAAYLGREATRHRRVARRAREMEIQLQTVDAFTHPLPDELRDKLRTELGQQVFAPPPVDHEDEKATGPSVVTDASTLIESVADLLKAAAASRPS
jgi:hypothetical protein